MEMKKLLEIIQQIDPMNDDLFNDMTDRSNGRLFAVIFHNELRFNTTARCWYRYDGKRWIKAEEGKYAGELAQMLSDAMEMYVAEAVNPDDLTEWQKRYLGHVRLMSKRRTRLTMLQDASEVKGNYFSSDELDRDDDLFACQNCVIRLSTREVLPHSPDFMITRIANVVYDPEKKSPEWQKFINEVFEDDEDKIGFVQKVLGYCMTADISQECAFIFYGSTTRNGKSTLLETVGYILGDYSKTVNPNSLAAFKKDGSAASPDIARLQGVRLARCAEPTKGMLLDGALFKRITGGKDELQARLLHENPVDFKPTFKLVINTNYLPSVNDQTVFESNRMRVITFDRHFEESEQDKHLSERLRTQDNASGILNWMLEGLTDYETFGLEPPAVVKAATQDYQENADKLGNFIKDCLDEAPDMKVEGQIMYNAYKWYCRDCELHPDGRTTFFEDLRGRGFMRKSGTINGKTKRNVVVGFSIKPEVSKHLL